jgi:Cu(I)/Ag(I) efflux system membrane fusion protein
MMKKYKYPKLLSGKWLHYGLFLVTGVFIGWIFFHSTGSHQEKHEHMTETAQGTVWTCSMHPHIRMEQPGKCPICGMDLIPLVQVGSSSHDPDAIHLTREAAALANVLTTKVSKQNPVKEIRLYGKVQADERLFQSQVSHVPGRIEKLFVNFTGEQIRSGQKLAEIYSPELVTAQQELLETVKTKQLQPELYEASKEKLRQWKLTDDQIASIENSGRIIDNFAVLSNTSGTIISRRISAGDYVTAGSVLFEVADLSMVWILFDAYETDLPFLQKGERVKFTIQAMPGSELSGNIVFIDPILDPVTRVAKVRVEAANHSGKLKPEMFATGVVSSSLKDYKDNIIIPGSAVLWTGKRSIVYVKDTSTDEPVFRLREIGLGPALSEGYVVTGGLAEGEEIVTQGTFSVDAASQLEGKPSMMNLQARETGIDKEFIMQVNNLLDQYMKLKDYLVLDDSKMAKQAASSLLKAVSGVDMKLLSGDSHLKWMEVSGGIAESLASIINSEGLEQERKAFQTLSKDLYSAIKTFGLIDKTVYYQFCPMYDNNKGGYWLSETEEIRNPYFGKIMLSCGETRETLKY